SARARVGRRQHPRQRRRARSDPRPAVDLGGGVARRRASDAARAMGRRGRNREDRHGVSRQRLRHRRNRAGGWRPTREIIPSGMPLALLVVAIAVAGVALSILRRRQARSEARRVVTATIAAALAERADDSNAPEEAIRHLVPEFADWCVLYVVDGEKV